MQKLLNLLIQGNYDGKIQLHIILLGVQRANELGLVETSHCELYNQKSRRVVTFRRAQQLEILGLYPR